PTLTLFPYTTLFRSRAVWIDPAGDAVFISRFVDAAVALSLASFLLAGTSLSVCADTAFVNKGDKFLQQFAATQPPATQVSVILQDRKSTRLNSSHDQ